MTLDDLLAEFERLGEDRNVEGSVLDGWEVFKAIARRPLEDVLDFAPVDELMFEAHPAPEGAEVIFTRSAKEYDDVGDYVDTTALSVFYTVLEPIRGLGLEGIKVLGYGATYTAPPLGESVEDFIARVEATAVIRELVANPSAARGQTSFSMG
jgi:hypothetical protein